MIKSVFVDQFNFLHVSTGNNSLLGHVLLELVVGPVLQRVVHLLANVPILVPSGKFSVTPNLSQ